MQATHPRHEFVSSDPQILDIAFDDRDLDVECGFLEHLSRNLGRGCLDSYVEVCAAPGHHVHRFASRGVRSYATVCLRAALGYAEEKARRFGRPPEEDNLPAAEDRPGAGGDARTESPGSGEHPGDDSNGAPAQMLLADAHDFTLPEAVDLAFCPRGALHDELTSEDVLTHLVAVAKNLGRGGLYVIELEHPAVLFGQRPATWSWETRRAGVRVRTTRRLDVAGMDPLTQVCDQELLFEIEEAGQRREIRDVAPFRGFTHQEFRTLVKQTGVFDWVATFGDLSLAQPFDTSEDARALVPVLRCSV